MGSKIKEYREKLRMSQEELAEKANVSRTIISHLENGVSKNTTSNTLIKIAKALNTTVDQIFFN